jgi:type I restriction enzyme, S subunit
MAVNEWTNSNLISLLDVMKSGGTPNTSRSDFYGGEIPFVSIEDMSATRKYLQHTVKTLTREGLKNSNTWLVPENSLLYSIYATLGLVRISKVTLATNQAILAMIVNSKLIDQEYLYYWLEYVRDSVINLSSQTTQSNLNATTVKTFIVQHPESKKEQKKIAEVLSTIDRAIAQTEAIIAKQQRIKTGLMQDLLTKGIDENGNIRSEATHEFKDSAIGRIPVEWDVELLDKLGERGSGHTPNKSHPNYWNGGIKWVSLADSSKLDQIYILDTDKEISTQGLKNSSAVLHPKGTVILSRDAGVGKSAILGTEMAVSQHFIVWRCGKNLNNYYLYYWLQKEKPKFEGIASGSTIVTIGLQFFRQYQIAVPKLIDEQNLIAEIIKKSDESISKHRCNLEKLKRQKTGLMQNLLTGKVRVTNLLKKREPASL